MATPLQPVGPVHLAHRFAPLDAELLALLRGFSKDLDPDEARQRVTIEGDQALTAGVLGTLAVMASRLPEAMSSASPAAPNAV
jgi:hypothetical protein